MSALTVTGVCPRCSRPLALRTAHRDQSRFVGCTGYPRCKFTAPFLPELGQAPYESDLRQALRDMQSQLRYFQDRSHYYEAENRILAELLHQQRPPQGHIAKSAMDRALRKLAATCHPDRWQGAPVAEELTKQVLALREKVAEGSL